MTIQFCHTKFRQYMTKVGKRNIVIPVNSDVQGSISSTCLRAALTPADPKSTRSCLIWLSFLRFWDLTA